MSRKESDPTQTAALEAACRRVGLPLTTQRRVILEALVGRQDHPTADDILEQARARLPEMSRTTVYRVLETLVELGLAVKISSPGSAARFDPRVDRHHHLVCVQCERVMDFEAPGLNALPLPDTHATAFDVQDYSIHFRGMCADCRKRKRPEEGRAAARPKPRKGKSKGEQR